LAFITKHKDAAEKLGSCFVYYIARNRGNNEVAPMNHALIEATKRRDWKKYENIYLWQLRITSAVRWMEKRALEAKIGNILLICWEKDHTHCHRRILAEEIARRFGVEYKGELS